LLVAVPVPRTQHRGTTPGKIVSSGCGTIERGDDHLPDQLQTPAHSLRLLNEIAEPDALLEVGNSWADRIAQQAGLAVRLTKAALHAPREAHPYVDDLTQAVRFETDDNRHA